MAKSISAADFDALIGGGKPVVVDFTATWCGPCQQLAPHIDQLATELDGKVEVVKVDVDNESALASRFKVMSVPTVIYFKDGEEIGQTRGAMVAEINQKARELAG
jgi:thioredoxin 1